MIGRFESVAAQVASSVTYSAVRHIAELPWLLIAGEFSSQFGQEQNSYVLVIYRNSIAIGHGYLQPGLKLVAANSTEA